MVQVRRVVEVPLAALERLIEEGIAAGHGFPAKLRDEWLSGVKRFDGPGEGFFVAEEDGRVVGFCGLIRDPYTTDATVGRVRRLYVAESHRGRGVGRALVSDVVAYGRSGFRVLRVRALPAANRAFERLGFEAVDIPDATHRLILSSACGTIPAADTL